MIDVIDYGAGNLFSVFKALESLGAQPQIITAPEKYRGGKIIVPGVGAFGDAMNGLQSTGFAALVREQVRLGKPVLGICVGLQVLFAGSEESPGVPGLELFAEQVVRFPATNKVPHMGWNQLDVQRETKLLHGLRSGDFVYFAHSYCVPANDENYAAAVCHYSSSFVAVLARENLYGVQFHPEKSQKVGMQILKNFVELC
jgi:glutamine amidotransferase